MDIVNEAIRKLHFNIPEIILETTFSKLEKYANFPVSMDSIIRDEIIQSRILPDLNMIGGQEVSIPLQGLQKVPFFVPYDVGQAGVIITIPPDRRNNKQIVSVRSVALGMGITNPGFNTNPNVFDNLGRTAMNHAVPGTLPVTSEVIMLNENQILIKGAWLVPTEARLTCILANDDNLSNINPKAFHIFYDLVLLACKTYIYNKLFIKLDQGFLHGGYALGTIKEVVDSYADAGSLYAEKLGLWSVTAIFNDEQQRKKHLGLIAGNI